MSELSWRSVATVAAALYLMGASERHVPQPMRYLRHPHAANDGRITFSYLGDVWVADANGANPRRITTHVAHDDDPRFSPDGQWIAFTSNRMGNNDVFVVPAVGGEPKQLTWHTGNDAVQYWTPDGKGIVISSARGPHAYFSPLYVVPIDGSVPYPLPMDAGATGMIRQDGAVLAYNRVVPTYWRHGYKGNATGNIYVENLRNKEIVQLTNVDHKNFKNAKNDVYPMWGVDGKIYFSSERDSIYNIWRMDPDGKNLAQVTFHKTFGVQFPTISPDGRTIIYENEFDLWTLKVPDGRPQRLSISGTFDRVDNIVTREESNGSADGFAPAPNGEQVAVDYHGEIFIVPSDSALGEKTQVTNSAWRDRFESYSPDGKYIAYVSDESKEEEIWLYEVATGTRRMVSNHPSIKTGIRWAPNSAKLVFSGGNSLLQVDVAAGRQTELASQPGGYAVTDYSADGNWLVYTKRDASENAWIVLFDLRSKREIPVASLGRQTEVGFNAQRYANEGNGLLTADGTHVVFTGATASAAVNANLAAGAGMNQLFVVSLARLTANPEDPTVRARELADAAPTGGRQGGAAAPPPPMAELKVDTEGIMKRARQLTHETSPVTASFLARDGRSVFYVASDSGGPALFQINLDGTARRRITNGAFPSITPTPDRRFVFYRGGNAAGGRGGRGGGRGGAAPGNEVWRMTIANQRKERVPFTLAVKVDARGEWQQIFHESWRSMKYRFYDEKMHGVDYAAARARFEPMLEHIGDYEDVYALSNEVIGQLNASHSGVTGPPSRPVAGQYETHFLGFEMEPDEAGSRYRVSHIYRDGPADKEWIGLKVGDYVLAVDGKELKAPDNYWKLLTESVNTFVPVKVAKDAAGTGARTIRIQSVTNAATFGNIKYEEFVATNRDLVDKETGGRIAYVHIRSMGQPQLQRFRDEIDKYWDKQGVIIDIRYNTGGNIDEELIDIIQRQPYNHVNQRYGARTWGRRPRTAIAGPKVMLINSRSFSDGEATPAAFHTLNLGTLVGTPTAGGAIWTGSYSLINGASIRTPGSLAVTWDPTKPLNYGTNLENYGVPPDVWVVNTPMDELHGNDRELKAACAEALRMLRTGKYQYSAGQK